MIPRSPLPPRTRPLARRTGVKKVNRKRKASEFARRYGSRERVEWVKSRPCVVRGKGVRWVHASDCSGASENAHTANDGKGRKGNAETIAPLCRTAHHLLHSIGVLTFQAIFNVDLQAEAAATHRAWLRHTGASEEGT